MNCIKITAIIYIVGCALSYLIFALINIVAKEQNKVKGKILYIGVLSSWMVVVYCMILMYRKTTGKTIEKLPIFAGIYKDHEMLELTLNGFWINVIKDPNFDTPGKLPLKNSPLCKHYHHPKFPREDRCLGCPVFKQGFWCLSKESLFLEYVKRARIVNQVKGGMDQDIIKVFEAERVNAAIKVAKVFESIYRELKLKGK